MTKFKVGEKVRVNPNNDSGLRIFPRGIVKEITEDNQYMVLWTEPDLKWKLQPSKNLINYFDHELISLNQEKNFKKVKRYLGIKDE